MFGLENAGKTHLLYTGLVGNNTVANTLTMSTQSGNDLIQPTSGFNCEYVVGMKESFSVWDIGGHPQNREFWTYYVNNIKASVIIYVVNANECIERLRESKLVLHTLMTEPNIANAQLIVIFNSTISKYSNMIWVEQPFKKEQLVEVFKLSKLKQFKKSYEFDVNDQEKCNNMFDYVSSVLKQQQMKQKL